MSIGRSCDPLRIQRIAAASAMNPYASSLLPPATTPDGAVIYAIGDIHGRCDLLAAIHREIARDARLRPAHRRVVIYLGDYISRGVDCRRVVDQVIEWRPDGFQIVTLRGNHEELLLRFLASDLKAGRHWLAFGGMDALAHYGVDFDESATADKRALTDLRKRLSGALPEAHARFLRSLNIRHREGGYLFVHAGILPGVALDAQSDRDLVWIRNRFLKSDDDHGAVIVHGHCISPTPEVRLNRIGIDTGAYKTGVLTCLVLDGAERAFLQTGEGESMTSSSSGPVARPLSRGRSGVARQRAVSVQAGARPTTPHPAPVGRTQLTRRSDKGDDLKWPGRGQGYACAPIRASTRIAQQANINNIKEEHMNIKQIVIALALSGLVAGNAVAKEGADQYPHGAENWLAGALPPPGNYFLNYFGHYSGKLRDGDGDKVAGTSVSATFNAFRYVKVTNTKILGGDWAMHIIVPVVHQKVKLGNSATVSGLGDFIFTPFAVGWHAGDWHWLATLELYAPTGKYKSGDPRKSIGANYWSIEPVFAFTWLPKSGWEISARFMYNIKAKNKDFRPAPGAPKMDYESGDEFHVDYLVGKRFGPWGVGLSGYYVKQTTNDKLDGQTIPSALGPWSSGRKGEVFAIGPSVTYTGPTGTMFIAQWQHETHTKNRFSGDKAWFRLIMPF